MKIIFVKQSLLTRLLMAALTLWGICSCTKTKTDCELWEVMYEGTLTGPVGTCSIDLSCSGSQTMQSTFCGDALQNAKEGNTITVSEDQCCKKTMTFKRLIRKE